MNEVKDYKKINWMNGNVYTGTLGKVNVINENAWIGKWGKHLVIEGIVTVFPYYLHCLKYVWDCVTLVRFQVYRYINYHFLTTQ